MNQWEMIKTNTGKFENENGFVSVIYDEMITEEGLHIDLLIHDLIKLDCDDVLPAPEVQLATA